MVVKFKPGFNPKDPKAMCSSKTSKDGIMRCISPRLDASAFCEDAIYVTFDDGYPRAICVEKVVSEGAFSAANLVLLCVSSLMGLLL